MASVTHGFMKLFRGSSTAPGQAAHIQSGSRLTRRSSGLGELARVLRSDQTLCVLDLGSTSPTNIRYLTEKGHKIYSEDLLTASTDPALLSKDEQGKTNYLFARTRQAREKIQNWLKKIFLRNF